jgi:uncharacterized membrane protein
MKNKAGDVERALSALFGALLLGYAFLRRSKFSIPLGLFGAVALYRGVSGHLPLYPRSSGTRAPDLGEDDLQGIAVRHSITVDRPVDQIYEYCRQIDNLPLFIRHLDSVQPMNATRSRWTAKVDNQIDRIEWESEILFERKNELIAWRSLPGFLIENQMVIELKPEDAENQTKVVFQMSYAPSFDAQGIYKDLYRRLLGPLPESELRQNLQRFRELMHAMPV